MCCVCCDVMYCAVIWCAVLWCDVMWCNVLWCDVMLCDVPWCAVMWCDMLFVLWCDVICSVCCDVMWCAVMLCDVVCPDVLWWDVMCCDVLCHSVHATWTTKPFMMKELWSFNMSKIIKPLTWPNIPEVMNPQLCHYENSHAMYIQYIKVHLWCICVKTERKHIYNSHNYQHFAWNCQFHDI